MTRPPIDIGSLNLREAVRALLLDDGGHLLLVRYEFPTATVWGLPGGGLEPGVDDIAGLRREVEEELGLTDVVFGPHIWTREHVIPMLTGHDGQRDRVYLVRMPRFDPVPLIGWEALRDEFVHEIRWWSVAEIADVTDSKVLFMPRRLAHFAGEVLEHGPPEAPIDTGV
jgi:8-oxo-dGTP pyrophosphatase MutT (NUDIX family)